MSQSLTRPIVKSDACDYCHAKKIRCDKRKPQCYECIKRNITCNYGTRLKRGPKTPKSKNKTAKRKQKVQIQNIQNVQKPSPYLQSMLFELEFNKKILEVWKNLSVDMADGKLRPPPQFAPATEEFIRSPNAAHTMMTDFDTTYRLIYSLHNYALSLDFADKLWQTIIDINTTDLLSVISSFETAILVSMLEYLVVFQLCTKIYMHDDMAAHLSQITRYILNIVIYARDGLNDRLTPELTIQLMMCITLISNYYKMVLDRKTVVAYHALIQDLFEQNKSSPLFRKEVEARMLCRKILDCSTPELTEQCLQRLDELDKQGIMSPNLHFHLNNHLAFHVLRKRGQLSDADKAIQKAEYFINWHLRILPQDKRTAIQNFYMVRLFVVHSEVLFRMGNDESALQRIGQLYNTFAQLPTTLRRMTIANSLFFLLSMRTRGVFLATNYLAVIANSGPAAYQLSFSTLALPALDPRSNNNQQCEPEDELDDIIEDSSSSPHDDVLTPGMYLLNDRAYDAAFELASPSPNLYSQTCQYESSNANVKIDEEIELDPFSYVDYYLA